MYRNIIPHRGQTFVEKIYAQINRAVGTEPGEVAYLRHVEILFSIISTNMLHLTAHFYGQARPGSSVKRRNERSISRTREGYTTLTACLAKSCQLVFSLLTQTSKILILTLPGPLPLSLVVALRMWRTMAVSPAMRIV